MADRRVLLIDSDPQFEDLLAQVLAPYGVEVHATGDGADGLARAAELRPELLVIGVELPDKHGYALCNKAKRGVARDLPVVLASATVPPADLEQHRRLKVHADEYLDKRTITPEELVSKLDALMNLGLAVEELPIEEVPVEEEIAFDDDLVEETADVDLDGDGGFRREESTAVGGRGMDLVDPGIDAETEAVFAGLVDDPLLEGGLGSAEPLATSGRDLGVMHRHPTADTADAVEAQGGAAAAEVAPDDLADELAPAASDVAAASDAVPAARVPAPARPETARGEQDDEPDSSAQDFEPADLGLDGVLGAGDPSAARINELEEDVARLQAQLAEARKGTATFSREREFLNLREVINRKEREVLETKEELDRRDRLVLDGKEKVRELEKRLREADERALTVEGNLVNANETIAALHADKEKAHERERGLKARIDIAQAQLRKADEEYEAQKRRTAAEAQALQQQLDAGRQELERERRERRDEVRRLEENSAARLAEAAAHERSALAALERRLTDERESALAELRSELTRRMQRQAADHEAAAEALRAEHADALADRDAAHAAALADAERRRVAELEAAEDARQLVLASAEDRRARDLSAKAEEHRRAIEELRGEHAGAIARLEAERAAERARSDEERAAERAEAEERRTRELAAQADAHQAELEALDAAHAAQVGELRDEIAGLSQGLSSARERIKGLEGDLATTTATLAERDEEVARLRQELAHRDERIAAQKAELEQLERDHARTQEQLLKAYHKIKVDEGVVNKAKKAMAIALTLLDGEPQPGSGETASGT